MKPFLADPDVTLWHGDLNADYLELAATRLQQLSLLTAEARPQPTSAATTQEGNPEQSAM